MSFDRFRGSMYQGVKKSTISTGDGDILSNNNNMNVYVGVSSAGNKAADDWFEKIKTWLNPITEDFIFYHKTARNLRTKGTCDWFIDSPTFKRWRDKDLRFLACTGKAGAGKTVLSSTVVDHLEQSCKTVQYAYIRYDKKSSHTVAHILSTLLLQVIQRKRHISSDIRKIYQDYISQRDKTPDVKSLESILGKELSRVPQVFIIVDGLDEWMPPEEMSNTAEDLIYALETLSDNTKIMVTSRNSIPFPSTARGELQIRAHSEDIQAYLKRRRKTGLFRSITSSNKDKFEEDICQMIEDKAGGMFIVVHLVVENIAKLRTADDILNLLRDLNVTKGLDSVYRTTLERIKNSPDSDLAFKVLSWTLYTEDLSAEAIQLGVANLFKVSGKDISNQLTAIEFLCQICGGLVAISHRPQIFRFFETGEYRFRFIHFTTKESLGRIFDEYFPGAQNIVAASCLGYLSLCLSHVSLDEVEHIGIRREDLKHVAYGAIPSYELLRYAAFNWHKHTVRGIGEHVVRAAASEVYRTLHIARLVSSHRSPAYRSAFGIPEPACRSASCIAPSTNMAPQTYFLMSLASHGPLWILEEQWDDQFGRVRDDFGRTALFFAVSSNPQAVRFLMAKGLNPQERDTYYDRDPVSFAAEYGIVESIRLLLDQGVDIDCDCDNQGHAPLWYAVEYGKTDVIEFLLEKRADPHRPDHAGLTPLLHAIIDGTIDVVRLLLDKGVEPHRPDNAGRNPLLYAVKVGKMDVVKLLLDKGADPHRPDDAGRTSLLHAVIDGKMDAVKVLLDKGVDPNLPDNAGRTPLSYAVEIFGKRDLVKLLLDKGVDPNRPDNAGRTPLWYAVVKYGQITFVTVLRDEGADSNQPDNAKRTPLSSEVTYKRNEGKRDVVKLLLDNGADLNRPDSAGRTPLSYAVEEDSPTDVVLLLNEGADPNRPEEEGHTPLCYTNSQSFIANFLLERGAIQGRPGHRCHLKVSLSSHWPPFQGHRSPWQ